MGKRWHRGCRGVLPAAAARRAGSRDRPRAADCSGSRRGSATAWPPTQAVGRRAPQRVAVCARAGDGLRRPWPAACAGSRSRADRIDGIRSVPQAGGPARRARGSRGARSRPGPSSSAAARRRARRAGTCPGSSCRARDGSFAQVDVLDMRRPREAGPARRPSNSARSAMSREGDRDVQPPRLVAVDPPICGRVGRPRATAARRHKGSGRLRCHHPVTPGAAGICPDCGSVTLARHGAGTERVAELIGEAASPLPVFRLDSDSAAPAGAHLDILRRFEASDAGVLVGTQMVGKGHDFPDVVLSVVLDADATLRFPDFRSEERTFALVAQLAGRSGRGRKGGGPGPDAGSRRRDPPCGDARHGEAPRHRARAPPRSGVSALLPPRPARVRCARVGPRSGCRRDRPRAARRGASVRRPDAGARAAVPAPRQAPPPAPPQGARARGGRNRGRALLTGWLPVGPRGISLMSTSTRTALARGR